MNYLGSQAAVDTKVEARTGVYFGQTGYPCFVLATTKSLGNQPIAIQDPSQILQELRGANHLVDRVFEVALKGFFASGGKRLLVLPIQIDHKVEDLNSEYYSKCLGSDLGFSKRTGFHLLKDFDACCDLVSFPQAAVILAADELQSFYQKVSSDLDKTHQQFLLMDTPCFENTEKLKTWARSFHSDFASLFYPWIAIENTGFLPPSVLMASSIQNFDESQGIAHSPANQPLSNSFKLQFNLEPHEVQAMNQARINVLRRMPSKEVRLWGSYTCSARNDHTSLVHLSRSLWSIRDAIDRTAESFLLEARTNTTCEKLKEALEVMLANFQTTGLLLPQPNTNSYSVNCFLSQSQASHGSSGIEIDIQLCLERPDQYIGFKEQLQ